MTNSGCLNLNEHLIRLRLGDFEVVDDSQVVVISSVDSSLHDE